LLVHFFKLASAGTDQYHEKRSGKQRWKQDVQNPQDV
jgi:hypothetical protein